MTESQTPQEFTLRGIGISPGIVSGEATLIEGGDLRIPRYRITPPEVDEQIARIRRALEETEAEIRGTCEFPHQGCRVESYPALPCWP